MLTKAVIFGAISAVASVYALGKALKSFRLKRKIEDTATSKIATSAQGVSELQGFAWPKDKSFVSRNGQKLVYYKCELQKLVSRGSGKNRRTTWETQFTFIFHENFYVVDPTGLVEINAGTAELSFAESQITLWKNLHQDHKNYYTSTVIHSSVSGFPPSEAFFGLGASSFRLIENEIFCGGPIFVHGFYHPHSAKNLSIRSTGLTEFFRRTADVRSKSFKNLNSLIDKNRDGFINESELKFGYANQAALSISISEKTNAIESDFAIHGLMNSNADHPLFVADTHETHLVNRLERGQWASFLIGFLLLFVAVFMFYPNTVPPLKQFLSGGKNDFWGLRSITTTLPR